VALIKETFPGDEERALAIAKCESNFNPNARNPHNKDGTVDGGLWQINSVHDKKLDALGLDKFDPEDATTFARMLYEERGFRDWVCHTRGLAYNK
jgi:predicted NACHT family NTPase